VNFSQSIVAGLDKYTFSKVGNGDANLYFKNPIHVLTSLFLTAKNVRDFKLKATINISMTGEQIYTTPNIRSW